VTCVAADEELEDKLEGLLHQLRGMSGAALRLTKSALRRGADQGGVLALPQIEDLYIQDLMATADAREGIQAFLEKRKPLWQDC
jgi:cyclohexa-1,5-dienecarbonyl-CoA hydratase